MMIKIHYSSLKVFLRIMRKRPKSLERRTEKSKRPTEKFNTKSTTKSKNTRRRSPS